MVFHQMGSEKCQYRGYAAILTNDDFMLQHVDEMSVELLHYICMFVYLSLYCGIYLCVKNLDDFNVCSLYMKNLGGTFISF